MNISTSPKTKSSLRLRPSPWDLLVVIAITALAAGLFFLFLPKDPGDGSMLCTVSQSGQVLDTFELPVGMPDQTKTYGSYVLEINHGHLRMVSTPCANQDCVHTGWISRAGQSIVCLPGRFVVMLSAADGSDPGFDIVVK